MQIKGMALGPLQTNCYWITDETTKTALLFDPGLGPQPILQLLQPYKVEAIVLTHGHFDHIMGVQEAKDATGAPVWISAIEAGWLTDPMLNRSGIRTDILPRLCVGPAPDRLLQHGETFVFAGRPFHCRHTPGHTPGSLSFVTDGLVICGDVLFRRSIGRTDLPGGSMGELAASIHNRLFTLPDSVAVAPGHGPMTTIGAEKEQNPFVGRHGTIVPWTEVSSK